MEVELRPQIEMTEALVIFNDWLVLRGLSDETRRGYRIDSRQFERWLMDKHGFTEQIMNITIVQIEAFMRYLLEVRKCKPSSVNRKLNTLDMLFRCLKVRGFVNNNPMDGIERMKTYDTERVFLGRNEVEAILAAIEHPVLYYFVLTMAYSGIRVNECRNLKIADLDFNECYIKINHGKGGKHRLIPMNTRLAEQLKIYLDIHRPSTSSDYFFALERSGTVSTQYVNQILELAYKKANITKHVTSHILRHSFASYLVKQNIHIAIIQKILGHSSLKTTSIYLHIQQDEMREAIEKVDF